MYSLILLAVVGANTAAAPLLTSSEAITLSQQLGQACGQSTAEGLAVLPESMREQAIACFVRTTADSIGRALPRQVSPGATLESAEEQEATLLVLYVYLDDRQVKALKADENKWANDQANRTCRDPALVRVIDAGGAVVYLNKAAVKGETLRVDAVSDCH